MAARHEKGIYEQNILMHLLVSKWLSNVGVRVARDTVFQGIRPAAGFETGISWKKSWRGYRRMTPVYYTSIPGNVC